jgi:hydrogenase nickel incorporation protein HypA/HybF
MHELTVTQSILDIALESAGQAGGGKVGRINLIIGEMTGVVEECVRFYFRVISRGTAAEDAELAVCLVPITVRCQGCAETFLVRDAGWACPRCRGTELDIAGGRELVVESIEVSDGSEGP